MVEAVCPDIVGCYKGRFFGIECKAGKNKPTALQQKNLDDIASTEGIALLINEANMRDVTQLLVGAASKPTSRSLELEF